MLSQVRRKASEKVEGRDCISSKTNKFQHNNPMNIRLQPTQQEAIKQLASEFFENAKVFVFGSRTNMMQKGGDIDIYIQTTKQDALLKAKLAFLREFEKRFGEQKVDLLVDNGTKKKNIFVFAREEGILL
jgi:predicted nucleotidyltransferase